MDPYNLDRKMSAMRLNEPRSISQASNSSSTMYGQYYHQQASGISNPPAPYNPIHPSALKKPENVYANLEELSGEVSRLKARCPEPFIPPPQQFSTPSCEIVHRPSQSKLSLEEAMRYTPPNLMAPTSFRTEAPVYENIDFYSAPAPQTTKPAPSSAYQESNYHPVTSNFEQLKTNAYFAKQQPLQDVQPPQPISMTCKAYSPIHQQAASEIPAAIVTKRLPVGKVRGCTPRFILATKSDVPLVLKFSHLMPNYESMNAPTARKSWKREERKRTIFRITCQKAMKRPIEIY